MNGLLSSRAFILSKYPSGANSNLYACFAKQYGKLFFIAKGGQKAQAKLTASLEPGSLVDLELISSSKNQFLILTGSRLIFKPDFFHNSLRGTHNVLEALNLIDKISVFEKEGEKQENERIFLAMLFYFKKIFSNNTQNSLYRLSFFLKILKINGLEPNLQLCSVCGKKLNASMPFFYYNKKTGELSCCDRKVKKINLNAVKLVNFLLRVNYDMLKKVKVEERLLREVEVFVENHLFYCLY